jgi:hypothetical protein
MSPQEFGTLKRYAMKMARDEDDRDELVLQAYEEGVRLGQRRSMPLLVNFMKLRSREMSRSFVGAKLGGKSIRDIWHQKPVSPCKPIDSNSHTLGDFLASCAEDPYGLCLVSEFEEALNIKESEVGWEIAAGYTERESAHRLGLGHEQFRRLKAVVRNKAIEYLAYNWERPIRLAVSFARMGPIRRYSRRSSYGCFYREIHRWNKRTQAW